MVPSARYDFSDHDAIMSKGRHMVDEGTMVDTWATVGSCAQIGKERSLSGGLVSVGFLEPVQAAPVIVEDSAFIGSRCIIVEGVSCRK